MNIDKERLQQLESLDVNVLQSRLISPKWIDDPEAKSQLIVDLTAHFITYDTSYTSDKDMMLNAVEYLFSPFANTGFIEVHKLQTTDKRWALVVSPGKYSTEVKDAVNKASKLPKVILKSKPRNLEDKTILPVPMLHVHVDTVDLMGDLGTNIPYIYPQGENDSEKILFGRGAIDNKGQLAVSILLMYELFHRGRDGFLLSITSDEELGGIIEGLNLVSCLEGIVNFDLETTANKAGVIAGIQRTVSLLGKNFDMKKLLGNQIIKKYIEDGLLRIVEDSDEVAIAIDPALYSEKTKYFPKNVWHPYEIPGFEVNLEKKYFDLIMNALELNFPIEECEISDEHSTISRPNGYGDERVVNLMFHINTLLSLAHNMGLGFEGNSFIFSVPEYLPRHSPREGGLVRYFLQMEKTLMDFIIGVQDAQKLENF